MKTPGEKVRAFAEHHGLPQWARDYLLGVLGEAVLAERERCRLVAQGWAAREDVLSWSGREVAEAIARDVNNPREP